MFIFLKYEVILNRNTKARAKYKIIRHTLEMFKSILIPHLKIFPSSIDRQLYGFPIKYVCENCMANNNAFSPSGLTFLEVKIISFIFK